MIGFQQQSLDLMTLQIEIEKQLAKKYNRNQIEIQSLFFIVKGQ